MIKRTDGFERNNTSVKQSHCDPAQNVEATEGLLHLLPNECQVFEVHREGFSISTDRSRLDTDLVCRFILEESYWGREFSKPMLMRAIASSLPFGLYTPGGEQIGFARVVTDFSLFCYLRDVFILVPYRGQGLGTWLAETVLKHPDLASVPAWILKTTDAHEVYAKVGFGPLKDASCFMQFQRRVKHLPRMKVPEKTAKAWE